MKWLLFKLFIVIILTLGSLNWFLNYPIDFLYTYREPTMVESFVSHKITLTRTIKKTQDIIFIGDSACLGGVDADYVGKQLKKSVFNYGSVGWLGPVGYRVMLESYLKHHGNPEYVVLSIYPRMAQQVESRNPNFLRRFRREHDSQYAPFGFDYFVDFSDVFKQRLRTFIGSWNQINHKQLFNQPRDPWPSHNDVYQTLLDQGGFYPDTRSLPIVAEPFRDLDPTNWFAESMGHFIDFAKDKNLNLLISFSPMADVNQGIRSSELEKWGDLIRKKEGIVVRYPELLLWPSDHFSKYSHLNLKGARRYSDEMVQFLKEQMKKN